MKTYREFRIKTEGFGELVWRPTAELNERIANAPSPHPQGLLAEVAELLANLAEMLSLELARPDQSGSIPAWLAEQIASSGISTSRIGAYRAEIVADLTSLMRHFSDSGLPVPPHGQGMDVHSADLLTIKLMEKHGVAR